MPIIQSSLPFNQLAAAGQAMAPVYGGNPQQALAALGPAYAAGYGAISSFNQANHGDIEKGFQQTAQQMQQEQGQISSGYGILRQDIRDQLAGYGRSATNDLNAQYAQARGAASQSLVSRGLGNSTIADSVQRGLGYDRARAGVDLQDRITAQRVGYDASLGGAALSYGERASQANAGLAQNQLAWMNSISAPYPNAGMFSQLASQYGAMGQANQDRELAQQLGQQAMQAGNRPQAGPTSMGGGTGFFRPGAGEGFAGLGGDAPQIGAGMPPMRRFAPPLGVVSSAAQGNAAASFWNGGAGVLAGGGQPAASYQSGFGAYGAPAGEGFGGGFGSQGYGYGAGADYNLAGEDQPYGQAPLASAGAWSPYGGSRMGSTAATSGYDLSNEDLPYGGY